MNSPNDITVFSPDGRPQVAVEAKALANKPPEWVARFRSNLMDGVPNQAAYFVIALLDRIYIWANAQNTASRLPDLELETAEVLGRYFPRHGKAATGDRQSQLDLSLAAWLDDLARNDPTLTETAWGKQLAQLGFLNAVRDGEIRVGKREREIEPLQLAFTTCWKVIVLPDMTK